VHRKKINGGMWLKLYENLNILGGEMNELYTSLYNIIQVYAGLYKFEGV